MRFRIILSLCIFVFCLVSSNCCEVIPKPLKLFYSSIHTKISITFKVFYASDGHIFHLFCWYSPEDISAWILLLFNFFQLFFFLSYTVIIIILCNNATKKMCWGKLQTMGNKYIFIEKKIKTERWKSIPAFFHKHNNNNCIKGGLWKIISTKIVICRL